MGCHSPGGAAPYGCTPGSCVWTHALDPSAPPLPWAWAGSKCRLWPRAQAHFLGTFLCLYLLLPPLQAFFLGPLMYHRVCKELFVYWPRAAN